MKLCVLLGGPSAEREVSLLSGSAMARAYEKLGHDVTLLDPATGRAMRLKEFHVDPPHKEAPTPEALGEYTQGTVVIDSLNSSAVREADVVVLGLHGVPGEDGLIQAVLELMGKAFTGSDARASGVCIDKALTKILLERAGIPTPAWVSIEAGVSEARVRAIYQDAAKELGIPLVIKPNDQGSTVGMTILREDVEDQFVDAVKLAWRYSKKALIEEFIEGRELTVGVIDGEPLPIVEIEPEGGYYDYHHKYTKGMTKYTSPALIDKSLTESIQRDALHVFNVCGARGYARIDYRLDGDGKWYCLEINTLPGMTETSLVPKAAAAAGMSFETLCEKILGSAFERPLVI